MGGAVQEPRDLPIGSCFTVGGTFFSVCFLALTFSTRKHICHQIDPQKNSKIHSKPGPGPILFDFLHTLLLLPCAMFLIDFTVPICSKTHHKLNKNKALETQ